MTTVIDQQELEAAIAAAELDEEESRAVMAMVVGGVGTIEEAVQAALAARTETPPAPAAKSDQGEGDKPSSRQLRELVKENERHIETVRDIMGGFVEGFAACSKCETLGLEPPGPKPRSHEFYKACETCNGFGQVLTGSLEEQYAAIACPDCGGRGFLELLVDNTPAAELVKGLRAQRAVLPATELATVQPAPAAPAGGETSFGRPSWMGDPALGQ